MGMNATAILFYGIIFPEDYTLPWSEHEDREFLSDVLSQGRVAAKEVKKQAKEAGIKDRTLANAKRKLGVKSARDGFGRGSTCFWELPAKPKGNKDRP